MAFLDSDSQFARFDSINQPPACRDDGGGALLPPVIGALVQQHGAEQVLASPTTRVLRSTKQRLVDDAERTRKRLQEFGALLSRDKENATSTAATQLPATTAVAPAASPETPAAGGSACDLAALRTQFDQLLAHYRQLGTGLAEQQASAASQRQEIELLLVHMAQVLARLGFSTDDALGSSAATPAETLSVSQEASLAEYAPLLRSLALLLAQQQQQHSQPQPQPPPPPQSL